MPIIHDLEWTAHYYHLLVPDGPEQNFLPVSRDFSDLEEKVQYLLEHREEAQRIADNAVMAFRKSYTSLAAEACYWRQLLRSYSTVASQPEPFEMKTMDVGGERMERPRLRGVPVEEILVS